MEQSINIPNINVKVKFLYFNSTLPTLAHTTDVGFDVHATSCKYDVVNDCFIYGSGIELEMPDNIFCDARARSSGYKTDCYIPYGVGTIDPGYRGEIKFIYKPRTSNYLVTTINRILNRGFGFRMKLPEPPFAIGDKVGQLVFFRKLNIELTQVDEVADSDRGKGGFGSTGKK